MEVWEPSDWTGQTELSFRLIAPSDSITYVWVTIDLEPDGWVNEMDEPASNHSSEDRGRVVTETTAITDHHIALVD